MKPVSIVLSLDIAVSTLIFLVFVFLLNRVEMLPIPLTFFAAVNLLLSGLFFLDKKGKIGWAFIAGFLFVAILSGFSWYWTTVYGADYVQAQIVSL